MKKYDRYIEKKYKNKVKTHRRVWYNGVFTHVNKERELENKVSFSLKIIVSRQNFTIEK